MEAERSLKREGTARNFSDISENASKEASTTRGQHLYRQALAGTHTDAHRDKDTKVDTKKPRQTQKPPTNTRC